jgi:hypothetical protein
MKNRRIRISQSQLGRLVENNVNENTGGVGNLSTDDSPNIGMGSSKLVTKTHMNKPAGRLNIMGGTNPKEFKEGGRKEPQGMSYRKEMTGENSHTIAHSDQQDFFNEGDEDIHMDVLTHVPSDEIVRGSGGPSGKPDLPNKPGPLEERIQEDLVQAWGGSPNHHCVCVYCCTNGNYTHEYNDDSSCDCSMGGDCCSSTGMSGGELVDVEKGKTKHHMDKKKTKAGGAGCESDADCEEGECCYTAQCLDCKDVPGEKVNPRVIRRQDKDKARRRPYSSKARDMRGSR